MQNLVGGFRYAVRQFRLSPVFTIAAVLTLALGIGGTTAIFTLIHAVMLRSLPVSDPARLYRIGDGDDCCVEGGPQDRWGMFSFPLYERLKAETPEFESVAAFQAGGARFSVRREGVETTARPLRSEFVTGNYFSTLGVGAFGGRVFGEGDDRPSASPVAVLSHHVWQGTYGGDPSVVGSSFVIDGHPFTIVGVAPPGFFGDTLRSDPPDLWIPLQQEPMIDGEAALLRQSVGAWLRVIGRLRPGASIEGMAPRLTGVLRQWMEHDSGYPANWMPDVVRLLPKQVINVVPAGAGVGEMKEEYGRSLQILLAVCGLVLLIACANVANLLLARAVARRGQTAVRLAIGATRRQIVMQALVESVLLAVGGGIAGLVVAMAAARLLLALAFRNSHFLPISTWPSLMVLAFAFGVALVTGIVFGAAPAWFATRTDPADALRGAGRSTSDHSSFTRKALLVVQATLSVVLVAGATMLARSLNKLEHQDFGYQVQGRVLVSLNRPPAAYTQPKLATLYREIEERLRLELQSHFISGIMVVTNAAPGALEALLTRALAEVDPNLTITSVRTMQQQVDLSFDQQRAVASLAGLFGIVALLLAAVGLYGVTAYSVAQRTNEIGIRIALGADRSKVVDLVLRGAFKRVMAGLVLGVPLAAGAGRLISAQLYGVSFWDPLALSVAAVSLAACALFAAIIPAGRAAALSPVIALRTE